MPYSRRVRVRRRFVCCAHRRGRDRVRGTVFHQPESYANKSENNGRRLIIEAYCTASASILRTSEVNDGFPRGGCVMLAADRPNHMSSSYGSAMNRTCPGPSLDSRGR